MPFNVNKKCCRGNAQSGGGSGPGPGPGDGQLLVNEDFDDGGGCGFDAYWNGSAPYDRPASETGHLPSEYTPSTAAARFGLPAGEVATPGGSTCAVHYFYRVGTNDITPAQVAKTPFPATDTFFVRWQEYFDDSGFVWPPGQKLARFFTNSGLGGILQFQWNTESSGNQSYTFLLNIFGVGDVFGGTFNYAEGPGFLALDTWHKMEVYCKQSSAAGVADGRLALWVNDVLLQDSGAGGIVTTNSDKMDGFWVGGNNTWTVGSGPGGHTSVPQSQSRFFADIEVYDELPTGMSLP